MKGRMRWVNKSVQDLNYNFFLIFFCVPATRGLLLSPLYLLPGTQLELWALGRGTIKCRAKGIWPQWPWLTGQGRNVTHSEQVLAPWLLVDSVTAGYLSLSLRQYQGLGSRGCSRQSLWLSDSESVPAWGPWALTRAQPKSVTIWFQVSIRASGGRRANLPTSSCQVSQAEYFSGSQLGTQSAPVPVAQAGSW